MLRSFLDIFRSKGILSKRFWLYQTIYFPHDILWYKLRCNLFSEFCKLCKLYKNSYAFRFCTTSVIIMENLFYFSSSASSKSHQNIVNFLDWYIRKNCRESLIKKEDLKPFRYELQRSIAYEAPHLKEIYAKAQSNRMDQLIGVCHQLFFN